MIKSAIVAMTIVGCDCDAKFCEFIRDHPPEWTTMEECETALKNRAVRDGGFDYPTVMAICSKLDRGDQPAMEALGAPTTPVPDMAQTHGATTLESGFLTRTAESYRSVRNRLGRAAGGTADLARETASWVAARIPVGF